MLFLHRTKYDLPKNSQNCMRSGKFWSVGPKGWGWGSITVITLPTPITNNHTKRSELPYKAERWLVLQEPWSIFNKITYHPVVHIPTGSEKNKSHSFNCLFCFYCYFKDVISQQCLLHQTSCVLDWELLLKPRSTGWDVWYTIDLECMHFLHHSFCIPIPQWVLHLWTSDSLLIIQVHNSSAAWTEV